MILHHILWDGAKQAIDSLKNALDELFYGFSSNQVKANPDAKCKC